MINHLPRAASNSESKLNSVSLLWFYDFSCFFKLLWKFLRNLRCSWRFKLTDEDKWQSNYNLLFLIVSASSNLKLLLFQALESSSSRFIQDISDYNDLWFSAQILNPPIKSCEMNQSVSEACLRVYRCRRKQLDKLAN